MAETDPAFEALLRYLKENRGFDFTGYKRTSLMRRVGRQMQSVGVEGYEAYQDYLEVHPEEYTVLFNTILINVTSFFRDADPWAYLHDDVLPRLVRERPTDLLRIWSAGCASGEEAYSLAMALVEILGEDEFRERVKIYATDVDEDALSLARHATYADRQLVGLSPEQIERFFERANGKYTFRKDLRRSVIFGRNDLVQDAPISRVDLLTCRNTLMYFNAEQQARIMQRLHFSLHAHGVLFLGKAEMLLSHSSLFEPVDLKRRVFRKVNGDSVRDDRGAAPGNGNNHADPRRARGTDDRLRDEALLTSPVAMIVIDDDGRVAVVNQRAEALFGVTPRDLGRPFQDFELSYRPVELRSYIDQATADRRPVWIRDVEWTRPGGETLYLDVQVVPLLVKRGAAAGVSVYFSDVTRYRQLHDELEYSNRQLETAYEELQSTNEELETTNEELQSTVEELETTNEELQSSNEELETMNEELQSMNDELQSGNEELRERTTEIGDLNQFMGSVLASLRGAVAVVDRDMRLLVWNERAEDLWGVRSDEAVGQHLLNLDIGLPVERLRPLVRAILTSDEGSAEELTLDAVNRKGRPIRVRVTASPLRHDKAVTGAILVIDEQEPG